MMVIRFRGIRFRGIRLQIYNIRKRLFQLEQDIILNVFRVNSYEGRLTNK